jgi:hypothetical protein
MKFILRKTARFYSVGLFVRKPAFKPWRNPVLSFKWLEKTIVCFFKPWKFDETGEDDVTEKVSF